ncbi:hypothetical protein HX021_03485 [Sphingobacterium sp. N143]|uniref:hypothetical protein n=1 Tax=Sphingobacterium sp. N143 TaxID=2746727 RepID=UPI00257741D2|nr:hypothetical protein [Sphingobacterium sp. N143]MDM1293355.1 hypothetical protein [Sphingobacterium sp. N143]
MAFPINKVYVTWDNVGDVVKRSTLKELTNDDGYITLKIPTNTAFDSIVHQAVYGNYIPLQTDL